MVSVLSWYASALVFSSFVFFDDPQHPLKVEMGLRSILQSLDRWWAEEGMRESNYPASKWTTVEIILTNSNLKQQRLTRPSTDPSAQLIRSLLELRHNFFTAKQFVFARMWIIPFASICLFSLQDFNAFKEFKREYFINIGSGYRHKKLLRTAKVENSKTHLVWTVFRDNKSTFEINMRQSIDVILEAMNAFDVVSNAHNGDHLLATIIEYERFPINRYAAYQYLANWNILSGIYNLLYRKSFYISSNDFEMSTLSSCIKMTFISDRNVESVIPQKME